MKSSLYVDKKNIAKPQCNSVCARNSSLTGLRNRHVNEALVPSPRTGVSRVAQGKQRACLGAVALLKLR